ncbi:hypothetical protein ANCCEY_02242 [Ancylostoma ceylanicum]|uniref:Uncharacterized protein n=1 Tax=Ancylostoma ceylanicum TaxID=53326 RepID=A0A0D6M5D6_9BILA|nr:hypothetical protein ANCCEY_02242 [Ancylostoma ceylanicum]
MDFASLSLLTTEQALADLAYFITSMNQKYGFKNPRWVTFGGSYPEYAQVVEDDLTVTNKDCPGNVRDAFQKMQNGESQKNLTDAKVCEIMMDTKEPDVIKRVYNVYLWYSLLTILDFAKAKEINVIKGTTE